MSQTADTSPEPTPPLTAEQMRAAILDRLHTFVTPDGFIGGSADAALADSLAALFTWATPTPWVLTQVYGGAAEVDTSDDVHTFLVDWDEARADPEYLTDKWEEFQVARAYLPDTYTKDVISSFRGDAARAGITLPDLG